jgi:hypothetical protein
MPAFPGGDSTLLVSQGGAYYLAIPSGRTTSYVLTQIGRVCKVINGSTIQAPNITFTDPDENWQFFNAQALGPNQVVDLQFPPSKGNVTIAFSAATSGPLTVLLL